MSIDDFADYSAKAGVVLTKFKDSFKSMTKEDGFHYFEQVFNYLAFNKEPEFKNNKDEILWGEIKEFLKQLEDD